MSDTNELKIVKLRVTQPLEVQWTCPDCQVLNIEIYYAAPGIVKVKCRGCKKIFLGER